MDDTREPRIQETTPLAQVRAQVVPLLGARTAKRVRAHTDGSLYVEASVGAALLAWLVDVVLVNTTAVFLGVLYYLRSDDPNKAGGAVVITLALLVLLPFLYGCCYSNGRALGALLTHTRLVRIADGSRIGFAKAGWAMLIRTLFLPFLFWVVIDGASDISEVRCSIDDPATQRLRQAGVTRLPAPGPR